MNLIPFSIRPTKPSTKTQDNLQIFQNFSKAVKMSTEIEPLPWNGVDYTKTFFPNYQQGLMPVSLSPTMTFPKTIAKTSHICIKSQLTNHTRLKLAMFRTLLEAIVSIIPMKSPPKWQSSSLPNCSSIAQSHPWSMIHDHGYL
jgi:hypothetical protein